MKIKYMLSVLIASFLFIWGLNWIIVKLKLKLPVYGSFSILLLALTILVLVIYKLFSSRKWRDFGIKKITFRDFKYSLYFIFLLFPIAFIGRLLDPSFDFWYAQQTGLLSLSGLFLSIVTMPLFVLKEEIFERSLIQSKLSESYGSVITLFLVSLNFAFMHFYITREMNHIAATVISVFFGSMILVLLYEITKNLFATIITHLVYNLIVIIQIYLHANNMSLVEIMFWIIFGLLFLVTYKKILEPVKKIIKFKRVSLNILDYVFIILFAGLPLLLYFLF